MILSLMGITIVLSIRFPFPFNITTAASGWTSLPI